MEFLVANFATMAALWALITVISEWVDKAWDLDGTPAQIRSIIFGIILATAGSYFNLGFFADPETGAFAWYYEGPIVGLAMGLIANFTFLTPLIKAVLVLIKVRPKE